MDIHTSFPIFFTLAFFLSVGGLFCSSAFAYVASHQRSRVEALLHSSTPLFWRIHRRFCDDESPDSFHFSLTCSRYVFEILVILVYTTYFFTTILSTEWFSNFLGSPWFTVLSLSALFISLLLITIFIGSVFPTTLGFLFPDTLLRCIKRPTFAYLLIVSPITVALCRLTRLLLPHTRFAPFSDRKAQLLEMVGGIEGQWTEQDRRLLQSVLNFRNRVAREIMRPRVDLFCIPENLSLKQATELLQREGYSRVPVYRETIDTIVGVLLYKDVLAKYAMAVDDPVNREALLSAPVKNLLKKVFYCPETKKIASLLQEFRKRQTHLAVVVDEYGGTSGLVTIEDILEEIVGEIADEYDEQESLFTSSPGGGWIVDARMNLLDVEEELGIKIPQEEDYDTLAGYIFYRVGSIPQAGLVLHHDTFEIEILKSNDRMVEEVRIVPIVADGPIEE